jgi:hypothetical protein
MGGTCVGGLYLAQGERYRPPRYRTEDRTRPPQSLRHSYALFQRVACPLDAEATRAVYLDGAEGHRTLTVGG